MYCYKATRTSGIKIQTCTTEVVKPTYSICEHIWCHSTGRILCLVFWIFMKQGFIIVRKATRVYCSIGARSLFNRYTGFDLPVVSKAYKLSKGVYTNHFRELESSIRSFKQATLLRIHLFSLGRRYTEEWGIKCSNLIIQKMSTSNRELMYELINYDNLQFMVASVGKLN